MRLKRQPKDESKKFKFNFKAKHKTKSATEECNNNVRKSIKNPVKTELPNRLSVIDEWLIKVYNKNVDKPEVGEQDTNRIEEKSKLTVKLENLNIQLVNGEYSVINSKSKTILKKTKNKDSKQLQRSALTYIKLAGNKFQCMECDFPADKSGLVISHDDSKHSTKIYKCLRCPFQSKTKCYYNSHVRSHSKPKIEKCPHCKKDIKSYSFRMHLKTHQRNEKSERKCDFCEYRSYNGANVTRHMLTHKDFLELESFKCNLCEYMTVLKDSLKIHKMRVHTKEGKWIKCKFCEYSTRRTGHLQRHMIIHSRTSIPCTVCFKYYAGEESLKSHMIRIHGDESEKRYFYCGLCPKEKQYKTTEKGNLVRHMVIHRTLDEIELFSCHKCSYLGKSKTALRDHFIGQHMPELHKFKCTTCMYTTHYKSRYSMHLREVHGKSESKNVKQKNKMENCENMTGHSDQNSNGDIEQIENNDEQLECDNFNMGDNNDTNDKCEGKSKVKVAGSWGST